MVRHETQIRDRIRELEAVRLRYREERPRTELVRDDESRTRHDIELLEWVLCESKPLHRLCTPEEFALKRKAAA